MAEKARALVDHDVPRADTDGRPPLDPGAIERAYRLHRARRRARVEWRREKRRAGRRFWFVLLLLLAAGVALFVLIVQEVQRLFGV
jgi:hypothetical protein